MHPVALDDELLEIWNDLPDPPEGCKVEITEHGEVIVSPPPAFAHQRITRALARQIEAKLGGEATTDAPILLPDAGIRCPDVVWLAPEQLDRLPGEGPLIAASTVPALVVEVLSPSNNRREMRRKIEAYLACGVREVVVVALDGTISYHRQDGEHAESALGVWLEVPGHLMRD